MIEKQQAKSVRILIMSVTVILFLTCFQLIQPANAVTFYSECESNLQTNMADETPSLIMMAKAANPHFEKYTVTYHPNGGTGKIIEVSANANTEYEIEPQEYYRRGYAFSSWNTSPDGSETVYYNEQVIDITSNITLFAMWAIAF